MDKSEKGGENSPGIALGFTGISLGNPVWICWDSAGAPYSLQIKSGKSGRVRGRSDSVADRFWFWFSGCDGWHVFANPILVAVRLRKVLVLVLVSAWYCASTFSAFYHLGAVHTIINRGNPLIINT